MQSVHVLYVQQAECVRGLICAAWILWVSVQDCVCVSAGGTHCLAAHMAAGVWAGFSTHIFLRLHLTSVQLLVGCDVQTQSTLCHWRISPLFNVNTQGLNTYVDHPRDSFLKLVHFLDANFNTWHYKITGITEWILQSSLCCRSKTTINSSSSDRLEHMVVHLLSCERIIPWFLTLLTVFVYYKYSDCSKTSRYEHKLQSLPWGRFIGLTET